MEVDVILISYAQETTIARAIESIIMQQTSASIHLIVADDCSPDNTSFIIKEHLEDCSFDFTWCKSSKNIGMVLNYKRAFDACRGKYVFILEGDDYWCSPFHIQNHINFLEGHLQCSMSMNRLTFYNSKTNDFSIGKWNDVDDVKYVTLKEQILQKNCLGNLSACCFRAKLINELPAKLYNLEFADWLLGMIMAQYGLIAILKESTSVYNINEQGQWSRLSREEQILQMIDLAKSYNKFFEGKYDCYFKRLLEDLKNSLIEENKLILRNYIPPICIFVVKLILPVKVYDKLRYLIYRDK